MAHEEADAAWSFAEASLNAGQPVPASVISVLAVLTIPAVHARLDATAVLVRV